MDKVMVTQEDRDWLILQLEAWPTRVDQNSTTNIEYLMREAAKALRSRLSPAPEGVDATGYAQGIEDAARLIEVHPMWVDGKSVGTDMRPASRVDLAKAIRTLSPTPVPGDERMREALENIARCSNASTDFKQVVQQLARAALTPPPKGQNDGA